MKVQHNRYPNWGPLEVIEQSDTYYIVWSPGLSALTAVKKSEYEPIPETRWVNVTGDFSWRNPEAINSLGGWTSIKHRILCCFGLPDGFRLVKVKRGDYRPNEDCFLIEKQE